MQFNVSKFQQTFMLKTNIICHMREGKFGLFIVVLVNYLVLIYIFLCTSVSVFKFFYKPVIKHCFLVYISGIKGKIW